MRAGRNDDTVDHERVAETRRLAVPSVAPVQVASKLDAIGGVMHVGWIRRESESARVACERHEEIVLATRGKAVAIERYVDLSADRRVRRREACVDDQRERVVHEIVV